MKITTQTSPSRRFMYWDLWPDDEVPTDTMVWDRRNNGFELITHNMQTEEDVQKDLPLSSIWGF